jgi:hypothetical protein
MNTSPLSNHELELHLNTLIHEYGLISVLESLHDVVKEKAQVLHPTSDEHTKILQASQAIADLIEALPEAIDIELALEQIAQTVSDGEEDDLKLTSGME